VKTFDAPKTFDGIIRFATPDDAPAVSKLIRKCYGDTYITPSLLDARVLREAIQDGSLTFALAETPEGAHIGQVGLSRIGSAGLYEFGKAIVQDDWRGLGLAGRMSQALLAERIPALGARFVMGRCVTSHTFVQRQARSDGLVPIGLLLGACPKEFEPSGFGPPEQPTSFLICVRRIEPAPRPRRLTLRGRDLNRALESLAALGVPAEWSRTGDPSAPLSATIERDPDLGLVHLRFTSGGPRRRLGPSFVEGAAAAGARLLWADVPVESGGAPDVVAQLRDLGFSYASYLPIAGPKGEDVLRLQRYLDPHPLSLDAIHVLDEAMEIRDSLYAEAVLEEALEEALVP
jgi:N-acetylglutamate synthase-like GNAT family acetyltransferase